jgi:hypothetical protein
MDLAHRSDDAALNQLHEPQVARMLMILSAHLRRDFFLGCQFGHEARFANRVRQWFLAIDVQPSLQGTDASRRMMMIGGGDYHCVELGMVKKLAVIEVLLGIREILTSCVEAARIHIAQSDDVFAGNRCQIRGAPSPYADDADVQTVVRTKYTASGKQARPQADSGCSNGRGFQELTTS